MARGSAPGERRGGRQKGVPNKNTHDIKSIASVHGKAAIDKLVAIMQRSSSEQAQVAAAKELLDRAYGRPSQPIAGDKDVPLFPAKIEVTLVDATG